MQRQLLIIRHADAERKAAGQDDHERALTAKGRGDALRVAAGIEQAGWAPQQLVCSDATRARQTWSCMEEVFDGSVQVSYTDDLYLAGVDSLLEVLYALDEELGRVALIAHNPGLQNLVAWLSNASVRMAPATAALLGGSGPSWAEALGQHDWRLEDVIQPDTLGLL